MEAVGSSETFVTIYKTTWFVSLYKMVNVTYTVLYGRTKILILKGPGERGAQTI